jgi:RNA polymerase sigma-70 factor (ECF subfamily)
VLRQAARGVVPADPFAWLLGTARHRVADHYRATQRDARRRARLMELADAAHAAFLDHPPRLGSAAGDGADVAEDPRLTHLRACLGRLTPKARSMLDARYTQSKPIDAIAAAVSWAPGSVKVALAKARKALGECVRRKLLAAGGDDE